MKASTKKFFAYFWDTFKESKFLIIKYVAVAVLYCVISILANLLGVEELTYLNAFLSIYAFSSILAFGISNGTAIFMNQNFDSDFKVRKYAKIGFEINMLFAVVSTVLLFCFPKFFIEILMGYHPQGYTFYYIMCAYFFISCINSYLFNIMKSLKFFKSQLICEALPLIITIIGFLILYFSGTYLLNYIAISYIIGAVVAVVVSFVVLFKNKRLSVNFFSLK